MERTLETITAPFIVPETPKQMIIFLILIFIVLLKSISDKLLFKTKIGPFTPTESQSWRSFTMCLVADGKI